MKVSCRQGGPLFGCGAVPTSRVAERCRQLEGRFLLSPSGGSMAFGVHVSPYKPRFCPIGKREARFFPSHQGNRWACLPYEPIRPVRFCPASLFGVRVFLQSLGSQADGRPVVLRSVPSFRRGGCREAARSVLRHPAEPFSAPLSMGAIVAKPHSILPCDLRFHVPATLRPRVLATLRRPPPLFLIDALSPFRRNRFLT